MKKFLAILYCFLLFGCASMPQYHDKEQEISLKLPKNISFTIEGYEINDNNIKVQRSFNSLKGKLSKEGFEDKEIEIKSHLTDDSWTTRGGLFDVDGTWTLLPPGRTLGFTGAGATWPAIVAILESNPIYLLATPFTIVGGFIYGLGADMYNLFYGIPSVIIKNPWYEYDKELDLSHEFLTPTPEFKKQCHDRKNYFIVDHSCRPCSDKKAIFATEEECKRCPNRQMTNGHCIIRVCPKGFFRSELGECYSCEEKYMVRANKTECSKCKNRVNRRWNACIQKCDKGFFRAVDGLCYSCKDPRTILSNRDECSASCPNRDGFGLDDEEDCALLSS